MGAVTVGAVVDVVVVELVGAAGLKSESLFPPSEKVGAAETAGAAGVVVVVVVVVALVVGSLKSESLFPPSEKMGAAGAVGAAGRVVVVVVEAGVGSLKSDS